jgi:DNA-binding MarR family transcriptional regulator
MTEPLADELVEQLTGIRRVLRRRLRADVGGPVLSSSQLELLRTVETTPGVRVAVAARAMRLASNSVSALVYQLVDAGYLRRETDPTDRRAARLFLTPGATARLDQWRAGRTRLVGTALAALPEADRRAIASAVPGLRRLAEQLEAVDVPTAVQT